MIYLCNKCCTVVGSKLKFHLLTLMITNQYLIATTVQNDAMFQSLNMHILHALLIYRYSNNINALEIKYGKRNFDKFTCVSDIC